MLDLSRGMGKPNPIADDELQLRTFWKRWGTLVQEGDRVSRGQPMAVIASREILIQGASAAQAKTHLAVAEAATGGLLAHAFSDLCGACKFFAGGVVCCSQDSKMILLGVPECLMQQHVVASPECSVAMATGVAEALQRAAKRGVACLVLVDAMGAASWWESEQPKALREAGVSLLALLMTLKLLESKQLRDAWVLVLLAYFLALTNFFYSQSLPTGALMLVTVLVITASLIGLQPGQRRLISELRTAASTISWPMRLILSAADK